MINMYKMKIKRFVLVKNKYEVIKWMFKVIKIIILNILEWWIILKMNIG